MNKQEIASTRAAVTGFIPLLTMIALSSALIAGCGQQNGSSEPAVNEAATEDKVVNMEPITELQITEIVVGEGATAEAGQDVVVHYTGWLYEPGEADSKGTKFDSSLDRGDPFVFPLGGGRVIRGWDEGVAGMNIGGKRLLVIPSDMGYGARGRGAIPPDATLMFEVELLEIR
jgi:FKBP-type peptidyl-prolyl cis-trans isomerase FkpA